MITSTTSKKRVIRRRRAPEERPEQILSAALEIFGEQGLAAARLDDIAQRAGIGKGTIYLYFATKEELFKAVVRREVITRIEDAERFQRDNADAPAAALLHEFLAKYWTSVRLKTSNAMFRIVMTELQKFPDLNAFYGKEVIARAWSVIAAMIQRGIDRAEFRPVDPHLVTRVFVASFLMHSVWMQPTSPSYPLLAHLAADDIRDALLDFFLSSLAPVATAPSAAAHNAAAHKKAAR